MFARLLAPLRGALALVLLALNTLVCGPVLLAFAVLKLLLPFRPVRRVIDPLLNGIATVWIAGNNGWIRLTQRVRWDVQGESHLRAQGWYLVTCNHQSWVDILVLQKVLSRRIPLLKFFLKQQLIYVPLIGLCWWALDFPFMRRHSPAVLKKHPELREQDREATRKACEKFALVPTSVMSFPEGTRFSPAKREAQNSPFRHLLKPKAGALAMSLNAMGERFRSLVDVTIVYPDGAPTFWQFATGRCQRIVVRVQQLPIPPEWCSGDYAGDPDFRRRFHSWLENLWAEKDRQIEQLAYAG